MTQPLLFEVEAARAGVPAKKAAKPKPKRRPKPTVAADARPTCIASGTGVWTVLFPAPDKLMSINTNKYWRTTNTCKKSWRDAMHQYAKALKLPRGLARVRIDVELRFPTAGRRDAANYHPYVVKPIVDALGPGRSYQIRKGPRAGTEVVEPGYGLIPDDTAQYLDGPYVRLAEPVRDKAMPYGQVAVTITDLSGVV